MTPPGKRSARLRGLALAGALTLAGGGEGLPHDFWINNSGYKSITGEHCCGDHDCKALKESEVVKVEGGWEIRATGERIPDAEAQVGEDGFFWRCQRYDGSRRCFFTPAGGT